MASSQENSMPFIRNMASSDRKAREQALASLCTFLSAKHISSSLSTLDILKLWKGLFYALWMCDRPLPQQQLCRDLAELVWILPEEAVAPWLRGFWATMAREWTTGIDVLRMEKFLLLVRRVLGVSLVWAQSRASEAAKTKKTTTNKKQAGGSSASRKRRADGKAVAADEAKTNDEVRWDTDKVEQVLRLLADWPLRPDEESRREPEEDGLMPKMVPVGLKLHAVDIWVDEAEKAGMLEGSEDESDAGGDETKNKREMKKKKTEASNDTLSGREVLQRINDLVETLRKETLSTAVRIRSKDSLADDRLPWNRSSGDEADGKDDDDEGWGGLGE
ncbi:hypothetical protein M406DRAFT_337681 [Cryphonectria parasitica EP155]|uniref:Ribosomal RNA-processing protein 1 n=1 Tax=Cryphonectria parasitica (strain ATCC 38755 / EP155) TaxID=660469 RepID=A0A9P4Y4D5_CRYP1|nr:uncharacterized protein M406DRAFT_337681 [Cryphonectria parasitica EP155]KAF3766734.1 hypothetical protein M406DRAFT_337681 [Cryphonectria parasitica EP155]